MNEEMKKNSVCLLLQLDGSDQKPVNSFLETPLKW